MNEVQYVMCGMIIIIVLQFVKGYKITRKPTQNNC